MPSMGSYAVIRYVPDQKRDEPRNIGVAIASNDLQTLRLRFRSSFRFMGIPRDDRRILHTLSRELESQLRRQAENLPPEAQLADAARSFANSLLFSDPKPCLISDPEAKLAELFDALVSRVKR
jgi:hypothetical protein